jgi:hypothetical protein
MTMATLDRITDHAEDLIAIRHDLCARQELGSEKVRTSGIDWTGVAGVSEGGRPGRTIG